MTATVTTSSTTAAGPATAWPTTLNGLRSFLRKLDLQQMHADLDAWAQSIRNSGPVGTSANAPDLAALAANPPGPSQLLAVGRRHQVPGPASFRHLQMLFVDEVNLNMDPAARARYVQLKLIGRLHNQLRQVPAMIVMLAPPKPDPANAAPIVDVPMESGTYNEPCNLAQNVPITPADADDRHSFESYKASSPGKTWWPRAAADLVDRGMFSSEIPLELLDVDLDLYAFLYTRARINQQQVNWWAYYAATSQARVISSRQRRPYAAASARLRHWVVSLDRFAPDQIASWFRAFELTHHQLSGEPSPTLKGSVTMPPAIASSSIVSALAADISARITAGQGGRLQVSGSEQAFSWGVGLPTTLLTFVPAAQIAGRRVDTFVVRSTTPAGTVLAPVAEGGSKPRVVGMTSAPVDLLKYAALATISTEMANFVSSIEQALVQVMGADLARAIEKALADELNAAAGVTITATSDLAADIISAIAAVAGNGGQASVLALSPADYVALMTKQGASGSYLSFTDPAQGPGLFFGLTPCIVSNLAAPLVLDPRGAITYEVAGGPLAILDIGSQIQTNAYQLAIETWAAPKVTSPGVVAKITGP